MGLLMDKLSLFCGKRFRSRLLVPVLAAGLMVASIAWAVAAFAGTGGADPVPAAAFEVRQVGSAQPVYVPVGPYERIEPFSDGMAQVYVNRKYGFIDSKGRMAIKPRYEQAGRFFEGRAPVAVLGNESFAGPQFKWGMIDKAGNTVVELAYLKIGDFSEGMAVIMDMNERGDDRAGFINPEGQYVIRPIYQDAFPFSEGRAAVKRLGYWGYIDHNGNQVTGLRYTLALPFTDGLAAVEVGEKWGYINRAGEMVIQPQFSFVGSFSNGMAAFDERVSERDWKSGFINRKGEKVIPARFDWVSDFRNGKAAVRLNGKMGLIDRSGQFQETSWDTLNQTSGSEQHPKKQVGFKDRKSGRWIIAPRFLEVGSFRQGRAKVRAASYPWKWGYVDRKGKTVIQPIYDEAGDFGNNGASVIFKGQPGFINASGKFTPGKAKPKTALSAAEQKTVDLYVTAMKAAFNSGNGGSGFIAVDFKDMNNISPAGRQLIMKQLGDLSPYVYDYAKVKNDSDKFDLSPNAWHAKNGTVLSISSANGQGDEVEISAGSLFGNLGAGWPTYRARYVNGRWLLELLTMSVS